MKVLLSILCGTIIVFVGGCVVTLAGDGGWLSIIAWTVVVLNVLMITAMWGVSGPMRPVFIGMAVIDLAVALVLGGVTLTYAGGDPDMLRWGLLTALAFLVKAGLSVAVSRQVKDQQP
jgi:hypothetical protein